ncbi:MAG: phosphoesterase [Campylobacterota bacterium]|nr:phosphoesterase [Campylobacterota bacterium]
MKKIYHLSHIDLDGYGCQLVMSYTPYTMISYNANYGAEVLERLKEILEAVKSHKDDATILISDLNLYPDESRMLHREVQDLCERGRNIEIILLDHHGSGEESAKKYEWYYLDTTRCATKIVYDYALEHFNLQSNEPEWLNSFVNVINAVDLWHQDDVDNFEYGKVCMRLITETRELNRVIFSNEDRNYKLSLLKKAAALRKDSSSNIELDASIHSFKKSFFMEDTDNTLDNLATAKVVSLLGLKRSTMTIYYKGYRGFLSYGVGNTSIVGNGFLLAYPEYDFIVDISYRGTMSLRANNQVDVSLIAKEWANGGGHPNASGGRIQGFKEQYRYDKVKEQIEKIVNKSESVAGKLEAKIED